MQQRLALQALGNLRATAACGLLLELVDDPTVRQNAISALGQIGAAAAQEKLRALMSSRDKKVARMAANAFRGGAPTPQRSDLTRQRLEKIRGEEARPLLQTSCVAAIRALPEHRAYPEPELTRLIGQVCSDYSTTRRELVMLSVRIWEGIEYTPRGLMTRDSGLYELTEFGGAVWRVERFLLANS